MLLITVYCSLITALPAPDLILHNAHVVTLGDNAPSAQALSIQGGRIVALGTNDSVLSTRGNETQTIDLKGQTVLPGFTDNHFHSIGGGSGVDLSAARSIADVVAAIQERAALTPSGEIIRSNSDWHEGQLEEQRLAYRDELDKATTEHPVVVVRGGHEFILNSIALERWDIDEATQAPDGGTIGRYPDGRLNGELVDHAKDLVHWPEPAPAPPNGEEDKPDKLRELEEQHRALNRAGLTSVRYAGGNAELYQQLLELKRQNRLSVRVDFLFRLSNHTPLADVEETVRSWGVELDNDTVGDAWLRIGGVKLGVDGGFEGGWLTKPYLGELGAGGTYFGLQTYESTLFVETVRKLHAMNLRVATHAVGDAAIDLVLEAYHAANADAPLSEQRFSIEHGFVVRPEQLAPIKELGIHVAAQHHLYVAAPSLSSYWGRERAEQVTPVKTYQDAGISVSLGTDAPVIPYPPLDVLYHFITRDTLSAGVFGEDQRIGRLEALGMMSRGYAELTFSEDQKGTLEVGKLADLVVLDRDILSCPENEIREATVMMTIVNGEIVYENPLVGRIPQ